VIGRITDIDPIKWVNKAIFGVVYGGDYSAVPTALIVCLGVAVAFIVAAAFLSRREAA
jgi:ABC-2 type transport system permease protein